MKPNFHLVQPASRKEMQEFSKMRSLSRVELPGSEILDTEDSIPFEGSSRYSLYCTVRLTFEDNDSVARHLICTFERKQQKEKWKNTMMELLKKQQISEIRYGDIDKDGDVDIAVKLTNGAIYVFHNLQVNK